MSTTPPITGWIPKVSPNPSPAEVHRHLTLLFQKLTNHTTAFGLLTHKINSIRSGTSTTIEEGGGGGGSITPFTPSAGIPVNNQSGVTSYSTVSGDDGTLIVFSDASPIAVALTSQSPPWSCFATNLGTGTATFTPAPGTINGGATFLLAANYTALIAFDGTSWWAAGAQLAIADILGLAAALALLAPIASPTFTGTVTEPTPPVLTAATTATSATAGAASALPATPLGYLEMSVNGVTVKVPYYSV